MATQSGNWWDTPVVSEPATAAAAEQPAAPTSTATPSALRRFVEPIAGLLDPRPLLGTMVRAGARGLQLRNPMDVIAGEMMAPNVTTFAKGVGAMQAGRPMEGAARAGLGLVPLIGPRVEQIGEQVAGGDIAGALGNTAALAAPSLVGKLGAVKSAVTAPVRGAARNTATNIHRYATGRATTPAQSQELLSKGFGTLTRRNLERAAGTPSLDPRYVNPQTQVYPRGDAGQFAKVTRQVRPETLRVMRDVVGRSPKAGPGVEQIAAGKVAGVAGGPFAQAAAVVGSSAHLPVPASFIAQRLQNLVGPMGRGTIESIRAALLSSLAAQQPEER